MRRIVSIVFAGCFLVACDAAKDESGGTEPGAGGAKVGALLSDQPPADVAALVDETKKAATDLSSNLDSALNTSFDAAKLKESLGSVSVENARSLADKLLAEVEKHKGLLTDLKAKASNLGGVEGIQAKIQEATQLLGGFKEKLQVVVDKLKASGIDVSKYVSALAG